MELRHLRYFVAVAEELNFRRAADRLFMEQPPLSRQIQQLEAEIGVLLFHRVKRHIELTTAGRVFLDEARRTLTQADQAVRAAQQAGRGEARNLAVGFCSCIDRSSYAFPAVVQAFREQHSDVNLTLTEMCSSVQAQALNDRQIDVGFTQISVTDEALVSRYLQRESLALVLPQDHPLAGLPEIPLCALAKERFLLFPAHVHPSLHQEIVTACARAGFRPNVVQEIVSSSMAVGLVGAGIGITFAPASMEATQQPLGVVFRSISDLALSVEHLIAWRRDDTSVVLTEFVGLARKMF